MKRARVLLPDSVLLKLVQLAEANGGRPLPAPQLTAAGITREMLRASARAGLVVAVPIEDRKTGTRLTGWLPVPPKTAA